MWVGLNMGGAVGYYDVMLKRVWTSKKMATSGKAYCPWTSRNTLVTSRRSSVTSER